MSCRMHGPPPHLAVPVSWRSPKLPWQLSHWTCWKNRRPWARIPRNKFWFQHQEVAWVAATRICQIVTGSLLSVWQGQKSESFSNPNSLQQSCQSFYGLLQTLSRVSTTISYLRGQILKWRWLRFQNTTNPVRLPKVKPCPFPESNGPNGRSHLLGR